MTICIYILCILFSNTLDFLVLVSMLTSLGSLFGQLGGKAGEAWYCHSHDWWKWIFGPSTSGQPTGKEVAGRNMTWGLKKWDDSWDFRLQFKGNLTTRGSNRMTSACQTRYVWKWCCTKTSNKSTFRRCVLCHGRRHNGAVKWHVSTFFDSQRERCQLVWPKFAANIVGGFMAQENWE
jgi:hypothetical protein